nr:helix-turn-helix domain-containing protein [Armatimonas sp.]
MIEVSGVEYLTVAEVAELKKVSISAVYKALRDGRLPQVDVLGRSLIPRESVSSYEPGSYGSEKRNHKTRGPGRPKVSTDTSS